VSSDQSARLANVERLLRRDTRVALLVAIVLASGIGFLAFRPAPTRHRFDTEGTEVVLSAIYNARNAVPSASVPKSQQNAAYMNWYDKVMPVVRRAAEIER